MPLSDKIAEYSNEIHGSLESGFLSIGIGIGVFIAFHIALRFLSHLRFNSSSAM